MIALLVRGVEFAVALTLLFLASHFRIPAVVGWRDWLFWGTVAGSVLLLMLELRNFKKNIFAFFIVLLAIASVTTAISLQAKHLWIKQQVLNAPPEKLERLGQHFIVGYRDFDEVKQLVEKRAIAGIFLTTRNIQNKTKQQIKKEVDTLQAIRKKQKLPPIWIATDQEGGIVSRMSPPLKQQPPLSELVKKTVSRDLVLEYARTQAKELAEVGVNLNFAPVVDLNKGIVNERDKYSQIYKRAISSEPETVAQVASWYCQALQNYGITCTLKHFPGLGRVRNDTHVEQADLLAPMNELAQEDWVPFRQLMQNSQAFVMLSHVKLWAIDPQFATSFSEKVIHNLLRQQWNYQGILITDDFSMQAVYGDMDGVEVATVRSLNAGTDLILVSFDHELYYELINAAINGYDQFQIKRDRLQQSQKRMQLYRQRNS